MKKWFKNEEPAVNLAKMLREKLMDRRVDREQRRIIICQRNLKEDCEYTKNSGRLGCRVI